MRTRSHHNHDYATTTRRLQRTCSSSSSSSKRPSTSEIAAAAAAASAATLPPPWIDSVQVFDNVFSPEVCDELHHLALDHVDRCESSIFYWKQKRQHIHSDLDTPQPLLTPLEQALQSCLQQLPSIPNNSSEINSDSIMIVEYWCRDEHMNIDAHADIDEQELLNEGTLRCPDFGHVLYLDVDPAVRGPTCVFSQYGGWKHNDDSSGDQEAVSLVTVPAVAGRVLRFPGQAIHGVPKPSTLWLLDKEEQRRALDQQDESDYDEDTRSVILFNVWTKQGPLGVLEDIDKGVIPDGIVIDDEDQEDEQENGSGSSMDRLIEDQRTRWEDEYGENCSDLWCQPRSEWDDVHVADNTNVECSETMLVRLMGNKARRLHPKKLAELKVPSVLRADLQNASEPHHFWLELQPPTS